MQIEFLHLSVYLEESPNVYGVWSFDGTLRCEGVRDATVKLALPLDVADAVEDCEIFDASGRAVRASKLGAGAEKVKLRLSWCLSANALSCTAEQVTLQLGKKQERLETWTGPIVEGE